MSKTDAKRKALFNKYASQLKDVVTAGLYNIELPYDHTFICPICLLPFSEEDLDVARTNHLTLEDAPPRSLGGSANTLTCKTCNNEAGYKVDAHLFNLLTEQEVRSFQPNTTAKVRMEEPSFLVSVPCYISS